MIRSITIALTLTLSLSLAACSDDPGGGGQGSGDTGTKGAPRFSSTPLTWEEAVALNHQGVAQMDMGKIIDAELSFRELRARAAKAPEGPLNLAIALLNTTEKEPAARDADYAECESLLREVMKSSPTNAWAPYCLGILLGHLGRDVQEQVAAFEVAVKLAPNDPDANYRLGAALKTRYSDTKDKADQIRSRELLEKAVRLQPHFQGAWYALFQARRGDRAAAREALEEFRLFEEAEIELGKKLALVYGAMGRYAMAKRTVANFEADGDASARTVTPNAFSTLSPLLTGTPTPAPALGRRPIPAGQNLREFLDETILPTLGGGLAAHDLDGDGRPEFFLADGRGPGRLLRFDGKSVTDITAQWGLDAPGLRALGAVFGDIDHDGRPDLYVYGAGPNRLFRNTGEKLEVLPGLEAGNAVTLSAQMADLDHDGDLDLLVGGWLSIPDSDAVAADGAFFPDAYAGARNYAYNNDRPTIYQKTGPDSFSERAALPATLIEEGERRTSSLLAFDADRDGDLDVAELVDGNAGRMLLNDRHWRYRDASKRWKMDDTAPGKGLVLLDGDQDGFPDLFIMRGEGFADALWRNAQGEVDEDRSALTPAQFAASDNPLAAHRLLPFDHDNDGTLEYVRVRDRDGGAGSELTLIASADPAARRGVLGRTVAGTSTPVSHHVTGMIALDADGDGRLELLLGGPGGYLTLASGDTDAGAANTHLELGLRGKRANDTAPVWGNHFGVGAFVEVAAGTRRSFHDLSTAGGFLSCPLPCLHVGLGGAEKADYVRTIWPDLVMQNERDLVAGKKHVYHEVNRKASSCPVLFKSDGKGGFDFVADFLGVGGLGFYVGPDLYAPPDETEMVRVGELPVDPDGRMRLRVSEPMEEICYIDRLALVGIEHPADSTVFADERLAISGPAPTGEARAFRKLWAPIRAVNQDGEETLEPLLDLDRVYAKGVRRDPRFIGYLADDLILELSFDQKDIRAARPSRDARLMLIVEGSVEYPYSHVNYAGTQADLKAESLSVTVAGGLGSWIEVATDVGYPAGMQRAMTLDVTKALEGDLNQLRLRTNLELYLDRVRLGWDEGRRITRRRRFDFDVAELRFLGYPHEYSPDGVLPTIYDYQRISKTTDWKAIDGRFTRYGDVRPLLRGVDDQYLIMNHGDEIALEVDASRLPALPAGWTRTWFLEADGWCKDMDPYTATPETVEPLPWHGMGDYPPAAEFPWTEALRAWDAEWNTREIEGGIAPEIRGR